jgi:hypothetical protein
MKYNKRTTSKKNFLDEYVQLPKAFAIDYDACFIF